MRDDDDFYGFRPYVSVGSRRARAARHAETLKKKGRTVAPVVVEGRKIAATFWGAAWCSNLERYSDYANRLPRGRTYVRNGSVVDLQIQPGRVTALVSGSRMYDVSMTVGAVSVARWNAICHDCSGVIDSLVELLQGRLSKGVMARLCHEGTGLFPSPRDIQFTCSCPDWASMCKHVAAVLYGIGARLDHQPELLFTLRQVDQQALIASAGVNLSQTRTRPASGRVLVEDDLSEMFGIDLAPEPTATPASARSVPIMPPAAVTVPASSRQNGLSRPVKSKTPALKRTTGKKALTLKRRQSIATRMREYWAKRRAQTQMRKQKPAKSS